MANRTATNIDDIIKEVNVETGISKNGSTYHLVVIVLDNGDKVSWLPDDRSLGRALIQEKELQQLRANAK